MILDKRAFLQSPRDGHVPSLISALKNTSGAGNEPQVDSLSPKPRR